MPKPTEMNDARPVMRQRPGESRPRAVVDPFVDALMRQRPTEDVPATLPGLLTGVRHTCRCVCPVILFTESGATTVPAKALCQGCEVAAAIVSGSFSPENS